MAESLLATLRQRAGAFLRESAFLEARSAYEELRAALVAKLGPDDPSVTAIDEVLGGVSRAAGDLATARRHYTVARDTYARTDPSRLARVEHALTHLDPLPAEILRTRPRLVLVHEGCEHRVDRDQLVLGRGIEHVHLFIQSAHLSRLHARVRWDGAAFLMEDLGSENGTLYEGLPITRRVIEDGDVYLAGGVVELRFASRPAAEPPRP